jgi:hypothetical protein
MTNVAIVHSGPSIGPPRKNDVQVEIGIILTRRVENVVVEDDGVDEKR